MTYDADGTQKRLDKAKAAIEKDKKRAAMESAGFTNSGDYDQWLVLEALRKAELDLRKRQKPPTKGLTSFSFDGSSMSAGVTVTGTIPIRHEGF